MLEHYKIISKSMTLSQALKALKDSMYALWIYREPEPFSYTRDVNELTASTGIEPLQDKK